MRMHSSYRAPGSHADTILTDIRWDIGYCCVNSHTPLMQFVVDLPWSPVYGKYTANWRRTVWHKLRQIEKISACQDVLDMPSIPRRIISTWFSDGKSAANPWRIAIPRQIYGEPTANCGVWVWAHRIPSSTQRSIGVENECWATDSKL